MWFSCSALDFLSAFYNFSKTFTKSTDNHQNKKEKEKKTLTFKWHIQYVLNYIRMHRQDRKEIGRTVNRMLFLTTKIWSPILFCTFWYSPPDK